ncbi:MAG: hypothetical protein ACRENX_09630 [Candidatus Dormibacteria bacterium]
MGLGGIGVGVAVGVAQGRGERWNRDLSEPREVPQQGRFVAAPAPAPRAPTEGPTDAEVAAAEAALADQVRWERNRQSLGDGNPAAAMVRGW